MEKSISRRRFLKTGSLAVGTIAAADLTAISRAFARQKAQSQVLFTKDLSPGGLLNIYAELNRTLPGNVAIKLHSGEPGGHYFPNPDLIKDLVQSLNGTVVECNIAYGGKRFETADHKQALEDHGFTAIAPVDIMDEEGDISLPFPNGKHITEDFVGSHFANYDSFMILSHFKGHMMGGFGGAIKNMSIGIASGEGKMWIHTAGGTRDRSNFGPAMQTPQDLFLESMAEAAGAVMSSLEDRIVYILSACWNFHLGFDTTLSTQPALEIPACA